MGNLNSLTDTSVVVDLSKYTSWEQTFLELQSVIVSRRSFWGDTSLILRFSDFDFLEKEADLLKDLIREVNIRVAQVQTNSARSWRVLRERGFQAGSIPNTKISNIGRSGVRLLKQSNNDLPPPPMMDIPFSPDIPNILPSDSFEARTVFIGTHENLVLRSGHSICYDGNVVLIGDVNPGCQIKLTGSIIVYGKLCGSVHAGFGIEDEDEVQQIFVKALKMGEPLQISIGNYSACSINQQEKNGRSKLLYPETARVIRGRIWRISDYE